MPGRAPTYRIFARLYAFFLLCSVTASAQTTDNPKPPAQSDDVIKVFTEQVQTDVMVFDRQGHFVNGLKREDFELRIDGKPRAINFFERVQAGAASEEAQLAAARGAQWAASDKTAPVPLDRGRPVFFFVDDMHLSPGSMDQAKKLLARYIDQDLKQNDEAEIMTATGRLGFLEQLTDNKVALRTAVERLTTRPGVVKDGRRPPMSEYQALQISRGDPDTTGYFIDEVLKDNRMLSRPSAEDEVTRRASMILEQAAYFTTITLASLETLIRSSAKLPGRKLIFLISDGFFIDNRNSDTTERIHRLTSVAGKTGAVIYSIDARGLVTGIADASVQVAVDRTHRLQRGGMGEITSSQDGLNAVARDTGGRALFNTNDLHIAVDKGLKETSVYYLLSWRPNRGEDSATKFRRLEVVIPGRPDLTVRVRRGFFDLTPPRVADKRKEPVKEKAEETPAQAKLREAIVAPFPGGGQIPISLTLNYVDTPDRGIAMSASMQVPGELLLFSSKTGEPKAQVDLGGAVFNDRGESSRFGEQVTVTAPTDSSKAANRNLTYSHTIYLPPGLYQVRVAARDAESGQIGTASAWIEIPDLSNHKLSLSSLIVGERPEPEAMTAKASGGPFPDPVQLSIDRRFKRNSYLRYLIYIYNSARAVMDSPPDVAMQMQILRESQPVATTTLKKVSTEGVADLQRLAYAAEIPLEGLPAGRYILKLTAIDRIAKSSASQQLRFEIH